MAYGTENDVTPHLEVKAHWHKTFYQIFHDFSPDEWKLEPTNAAMPNGWKTFKDSAKVKFVCRECGNSWTSMRGRVIFWFKKIDTNEKAVIRQEGDGEALKATTRDSNVCMYI